MAYSNDKLYIPPTFETLQNNTYNTYNTLLIDNSKNPITFDEYVDSNIKFAFQTSTEIDTQAGILAGLLYDNMIIFIQGQKEDLISKPYGSTLYGLTNALESLEGMNKVVIDEPNRDNTTLEPATINLALDFDTSKITDFQLWDCIYKNGGAGILTLGANEVTSSDRGGISRTYKYDNFTQKTLMVKLTFNYSNNYSGNKLSNEQIKANYVKHYADIYKIGTDIEPAKYNDISFYPSLAYLNSEFSIDGGTTYLDKNAVLYSEFNQEIVLNPNIAITRDT